MMESLIVLLFMIIDFYEGSDGEGDETKQHDQKEEVLISDVLRDQS